MSLDNDHWSSPNGCHPDCPACAAEGDVDESPDASGDSLMLAEVNAISVQQLLKRFVASLTLCDNRQDIACVIYQLQERVDLGLKRPMEGLAAIQEDLQAQGIKTLRGEDLSEYM